LPIGTAPDPRFLSVSQVLTTGYSNYEAGSLQIRHSFSYGFTGQFGWTWSHDMGIVAVANPHNLGLGYAPLGSIAKFIFEPFSAWPNVAKPL
jgi:hypothetical protein